MLRSQTHRVPAELIRRGVVRSCRCCLRARAMRALPPCSCLFLPGPGVHMPAVD